MFGSHAFRAHALDVGALVMVLVAASCPRAHADFPVEELDWKVCYQTFRGCCRSPGWRSLGPCPGEGELDTGCFMLKKEHSLMCHVLVGCVLPYIQLQGYGYCGGTASCVSEGNVHVHKNIATNEAACTYGLGGSRPCDNPRPCELGYQESPLFAWALGTAGCFAYPGYDPEEDFDSPEDPLDSCGARFDSCTCCDTMCPDQDECLYIPLIGCAGIGCPVGEEGYGMCRCYYFAGPGQLVCWNGPY